MTLVFEVLYDERRLKLSRNLHIIISIYAKDVLYNVARTLYIHAISRYANFQTFSILSLYLYFEGCKDALYHVVSDFLTDEVVDISILQAHFRVCDWGRVFVTNLHRNLTASELLTENSSLFQSIYCAVRVNAALETETCISAETVTTC